MPLDFVQLGKSHTGVYLAETVRVIVEKFGIRDKICGIVTNNASNNETMINEIKSYKSHKRNETILTSVDQEQYPDKDDEDADPAGPNDQIRMCTTGDSSDEDEDDNEHKLLNKENILASELISDNEIKLEDEDLIEMSDEDKDNQYTSTSCKLTLAKFRAVSRKLNKSPNSKSLFKELCHDLECLRPHNVGRDVLTRWNSTLEQLSSLIQCSPAILEWQKDKRYGTARQHHINQNNLDLAHDLVEVLQPFHEITLQVLIRGSAQIADIVFFIDQITSHLSSTISNKYDDYPPALRNTCRAGLQFTKKYYTLTDCSPLYRVATQWQPKWIEESIRLTRDMWETNYKPPPPQPTTSQRSNPGPKPPKGVLAGLAGASEARGGNTPTNPIHMWLAVGLSQDKKQHHTLNPLKWWIRQRQAGNTHGGLLQMALDMLSCPATTVDVERSSSFGRDYVSLRRHQLSASSVTQGMTVRFYSKNGKTGSGVLHKWKLKKRNEAKQRAASEGTGVQILSFLRQVPAPAAGTRVSSVSFEQNVEIHIPLGGMWRSTF
ncbi:hypothetical protein PSTG_12136 [Puccinia striiformis f. sp. tritici PST-78]|uniref:HAT C-terminal dimerisation domain-containing protein n=1 Tax=Puccinia striiformis f. sp. tritici PST-78 TaxID=1165861 RepID=A0A0L0V687_9BASI|nr:hypothetical protein PSTG_12136 [Puccinia striiformis f. sp. tritici PST-78]